MNSDLDTPNARQPEADVDPTATSRKGDHIALAFQSRVASAELDPRFDYEPLFSAHPPSGSLQPVRMLGAELRTPIWVSSMTGGTAMAGVINRNLARACAEFGMGMGLGSCRQLLYQHDHLADFDVRGLIGDGLPLYANLGIAQLEVLIARNETGRIGDLLDLLRADGLIIHVNPMQEALQPEGDVYAQPAIETIRSIVAIQGLKVVVKEVGQGFGPESLRALLDLPLEAIEFAAAGGTNFARLELLRSESHKQRVFGKMATVGHSAADMMHFLQQLVQEKNPQAKSLILSGGVADFLDGYYLLQQSPLPAVYGQASGLLAHAQGDYAELREYLAAQVRGLELAHAFLKVRS